MFWETFDDLRMLKKEDSTSAVLDLEPFPHRNSNDITGTCTTPHGEGASEGEDAEYGYPITCGDCTALLLIKKFVCPGINVRCVKFNNELISPKQFVYLSGKATLKDWKRAIRLGGVMLRKMMDSGQIDFYQHSTICSNTCHSTKGDIQRSRTRVHRSPSCVTETALREDFNDATRAEEFAEVKSAPKTGTGVFPNQSLKPATTSGHSAARERSDSPDEVLSFWKTVSDCGLMGDVMSSVQSHLFMILKGIEARSITSCLQVEDGVVLNTFCEMFGLLESVKQAVKLRDNLKEENENRLYGTKKHLKKRKRTESNSSSLKQLRLEHHRSLARSLSLLSPVATSPVISPLSALGLSERTTSPLHSAPVSTGTAPSAPLSDKSIGDGQKVKPERRLRESSNSRRQGADEEDRGAGEVRRGTRGRTAAAEDGLHLEEEADSCSRRDTG